MTAEAAIWQFFNSFGIPGYQNTAVPSDATYPYITYSLVIGSINDGEVNLPANVWYRTDGEAILNAKVRQIYTAVGLGGKILHCDDGMIWVKRGTPWSQAVSSESDSKVKGRLLNLDLEFIITE